MPNSEGCTIAIQSVLTLSSEPHTTTRVASDGHYAHARRLERIERVFDITRDVERACVHRASSRWRMRARE